MRFLEILAVLRCNFPIQKFLMIFLENYIFFFKPKYVNGIYEMCVLQPDDGLQLVQIVTIVGFFFPQV